MPGRRLARAPRKPAFQGGSRRVVSTAMKRLRVPHHGGPDQREMDFTLIHARSRPSHPFSRSQESRDEWRATGPRGQVRWRVVDAEPCVIERIRLSLPALRPHRSASHETPLFDQSFHRTVSIPLSCGVGVTISCRVATSPGTINCWRFRITDTRPSLLSPTHCDPGNSSPE